MDAKHVLTLLGLLSDLIGAVLLSIPMVWDTHAAAFSLIRFLRSVRYFLYGSERRHKTDSARLDEEIYSRLLATYFVLSLPFLIIVGRLIQVMIFENAASPEFLVHDPVLLIILIVASVLVVGAVIYFVSRLPRSEERRVGKGCRSQWLW